MIRNNKVCGMNENKTDDGGKITLSSGKTLGLKGGGLSHGTVRQKFSHGRTKSVVVETRKRRITKPGTPQGPILDKTPEPIIVKPKIALPTELESSESLENSPPLSNLSKEEMDTRRRALELAKIQEEKDREQAEEQQKIEALHILAQQQSEEKSPPVVEHPVEEVIHKVAPVEDAKRKEEKKIETPKHSVRHKPEETAKPSRSKSDENRRQTKLTLSNALNEEGNTRAPSLAAMRRRQEKARRVQKNSGLREKISREVMLPETITVQDFAQRYVGTRTGCD